MLAYRGEWADYTFARVLGHHVTFDVSDTTWVNSTGLAAAYLYVYNPSGTQVQSLALSSSPTHLDFTPTATGTWTVHLVPHTDSTGSASITPTF